MWLLLLQWQQVASTHQQQQQQRSRMKCLHKLQAFSRGLTKQWRGSCSCRSGQWAVCNKLMSTTHSRVGDSPALKYSPEGDESAQRLVPVGGNLGAAGPFLPPSWPQKHLVQPPQVCKQQALHQHHTHTAHGACKVLTKR
jgi:hypothetical protein